MYLQGPHAQPRRANVLIVDDDEGVRKVLTRWVEGLGHRVISAADAEQARDLLGDHEIDVALCDVLMPGHDGVWLAEQVRRLSPNTAVAFITGLAEMEPSVTLRPGVVGYVVKPFNRLEVEEIIERGLATREAQAARLFASRPLPPRLLE